MSEIITVKSATVIPKDIPSRQVTPPKASLEDMLARMAEDAKQWKERKASAWGENMGVGRDVLAKKPRTRWNDRQIHNLEAEIIRVLTNNPPMSRHYMESVIRGACNRHALGRTLTAMHRAGKVEVNHRGNIAIWSLPVNEAVPPAVIVRGVPYATVAQCAKALGVKHQTVTSAIKRGKPDGIGMCRNWGRKK
jgi:hypothetical protein